MDNKNMGNKNDLQFRSKLSIVRGLGSAKTGVSHWWLQRVTAVAMIPLALWFVSSIISVMLTSDVFVIARWFASPINALLVVMLLFAMFYHAKLGIQVVIEDYVKCHYVKYSLLIANNFFCFILATISIVSVLKLHFLNIVATSF